MKGMELCEAYYHEICAPRLREKFPQQMGRIAAGLVGEGSECLGFDDELSRDHDFGPAVMLWLTDEDAAAFGRELQAEVGRLPREFAGFPARTESAYGDGRTGVFSIRRFYARFIGLERPPETIAEWRRVPETYLAVATNGKVFVDPLGEFSRFRAALLDFYPEDVRLKKMGARCMKMAQAGQYNYPRCLKRNEPVAAWMAAAEFIDAAISMVFLLNRRYKPFYKWMHRAVAELPLLGRETHRTLARLASPDCPNGVECIEELCAAIIAELQREGLTDSNSDFLLDHGPSIQLRIEDPSLRAMHPLAE